MTRFINQRAQIKKQKNRASPKNKNKDKKIQNKNKKIKNRDKNHSVENLQIIGTNADVDSNIKTGIEIDSDIRKLENTVMHMVIEMAENRTCIKELYEITTKEDENINNYNKILTQKVDDVRDANIQSINNIVESVNNQFTDIKNSIAQLDMFNNKILDIKKQMRDSVVLTENLNEEIVNIKKNIEEINNNILNIGGEQKNIYFDLNEKYNKLALKVENLNHTDGDTDYVDRDVKNINKKNSAPDTRITEKKHNRIYSIPIQQALYLNMLESSQFM